MSKPNIFIKTRKSIIGVMLLTLIGCSSNKIKPDNNVIYMSTDRAPANCKFIAEMTHLHSTYTLVPNPSLGKNTAMAQVDEARILGANYIEIDSDETGDAYKCPESVLKTMNKHNWNN